MKYRITIVLILAYLISFGMVNAQDTLDDVHLFQTFFRDAPIATSPYGEAGFQYADFDYNNYSFSTFLLGVQGGYPINPQLEIGTALNYIKFNPEKGDGESGISDLKVVGRYNISPKKTKISAGGYLTLPIGEEKIGQSNFNFGGFGALRHPLDNGMVITATLGLDLFETKDEKGEDDRETSIILGGGAIYPINEQLCAIGELNLWTEGDYMMLTGGLDYKLQSGSKIRAALGIGLDDGAPDIFLQGSFLHSF